MRLTRRFTINSLDNIPLSECIEYERYYINDNLRIQKKDDIYEKEILDNDNILIKKGKITKEEFDELKKLAYTKIKRDSYLKDENVSIKKYYGDYEGLIRVEVNFKDEEEMKNYIKEGWMQKEITSSPLAFDKYLSKLNREEFLKELNKYI